MTLSPPQAFHAQAKRTREPGGRVKPGALNHCVEANIAMGTRGHPRPESQFAGAARASGACHWNVQKRSTNHSEKPEIEQKGSEHPETLKHAQRMFGIEADKRGGQDSQQEPSEAAGNAQLQLEVFPHTHGPIVLASAPIRSLSHPGDMSHKMHAAIALLPRTSTEQWKQLGAPYMKE
jgi:hypothetical protein